MTFGAALGTAAAVLLGAVGFSGLGSASAEKSSGDRPVFITIDPCRVTDTRATVGIGGRTTPIGAAETHDIDVRPTSGDCAGKIPTDALAVQLNVTALGATSGTFLTLHEAGTPTPNASALNPVPGQPATPNAVTTKINAAGEFSIYNEAGTVNVLVDISGYYVAHNHDDDRPSRINIGHTEFHGVTNPVEFRAIGSGFTTGASNQCMTAHVPLDADAAVTGFAVSVSSPLPTLLDYRLVKTRLAPGTSLTTSELREVLLSGTLGTGSVGTVNLGSTPAISPIVPNLDNHNFYIEVCGPDPYAVLGAVVQVEYN